MTSLGILCLLLSIASLLQYINHRYLEKQVKALTIAMGMILNDKLTELKEALEVKEDRVKEK